MIALTLARAELHRLFLSPLSWLVLACVGGLSAWLAIVQLWGYERLADRLALLPEPPGLTAIVVAPVLETTALLMIPVASLLSLRGFAGERQGGTMALLTSSPVSAAELVLAKFIASSCFLAVLLLVVACMPAVLLSGAALDAGLCAAGFLGLGASALLLSAVAVTTSSVTTRAPVAAILTLLAAVGLWVVGGGAAGEAAGPILRHLSWPSHLRPLLSGIVDTGDLAYFAATTAGLLVLTALWLRAQAVAGRALIRGCAKVVVVVSVAVAVVWAAQTYSIRSDWTANAGHSLRPASASLLERAEGRLSITAYAAEDGVARGAVRALVERYQQLKPDIELIFIDPEKAPDEARTLNIGPRPELLLSLGGRAEHARELNEFSVSNALARLVKGSEHWVAVLAGHDERAADGERNGDLRAFTAELERVGYRVRPLNLANTESVPDNTSVLLLSEPRAPWRPEEVDRVERYIADGGNLLWLADPSNPPALPWLSQRLGLSFGPGAVVDPAGSDPGIVVANGYSSHPAVAELRTNILFPLVTPITWERPDGFMTTGLVSTGLRAWAESGPLNAAVTFDQASDMAGPLDLAIALSSTNEVGGGPEQRIAVFGDGDFLSNAFLGEGANLALGLNIVNWLAGADALIDIAPRDVVDARFEPGPRARWLIALGPPVALPLILLVAGGWIWRRRKRL